jgi:hypothetical protein
MSTFAATEALRIVLREEQPAAMADVLLDMERARMTTEDLPWRLRAAMASPYTTSTNEWPPHPRNLSWREVGIERNDRCDHVTFTVIEPAKELLQDARHEILTALSVRKLNYEAAMNAAHDAMREVERRLEDDSDASESTADASESTAVPQRSLEDDSAASELESES